MSYFFGDGFDLYSVLTDCLNNHWDGGVGPATLQLNASGRFAGSRSVGPLSSNTGPYISKTSGSNDAVHHIVVAYQQQQPLSGTSGGLFFTLGDGATIQCCFVFRSDGAIVLTAGNPTGAALATYVGAVAIANAWYSFEIEIVIHNTNGSIAIRRNGNTVNDFFLGSLNTRNGTANNYANKIGFACNWGVTNAQLIDDFLWRSDAVSVPWVGDIRCYTRMPVSDVSAQFIPTGSRSIAFGATSGLGLVTNRAWYGAFTPIGTSSISTVIFQTGPITGNLKCAIFTDIAGAPGNLVATATAPLVAPSSGASFTFSPAVLVTGNVKYWIGFCISGTGGSMTGGLPADGYFSDATPYASWPPSTVVTLTSGSTRAIGSTIIMVPAVNAACVGEPQQDAATTYVYSSTVGQSDLYAIGTISGTPANILGVTTRGYFQKSDAGTRNAAVQLKSGAATVQSASTPLNAGTWTWIERNDFVDPATGAPWTAAAVNNINIGPVITA